MSMSSLSPLAGAAGARAADALALHAPHLPNPQQVRSSKTAQDFEAMVASQMLSPMFNTVEVDPMFGGGEGEEAFRGFLVQEYGRVAASTGSFGIAPQMQALMLRLAGGNHE